MRAASEVNGMDRTMVVAGKTSGTQAVVLPFGGIAAGTVDVPYGAHPLALAATNAGTLIDGKFGIGDPVLEEVTAEHNAVGAWPAALVDVLQAPLTVHDSGHHRRQLLPGSGNLAFGGFVGVNLVNDREIVRLGHDDRENAVESDTDSLEILCQVIKCKAHIIATSGKGITILVLVTAQPEALDEVPDKERRPPTVNGETNADALIKL